MIFLNLYLTFLKIGAFAFGGGYATIPLIRRFVVEENGWLSMQEFLDVVSISQMTPGPIAINSATFVGQKVAGLFGGILATLGVVTPQTILMLFLAYFLFKKQKTFKGLSYMIIGIKACVVSLILITAISLFNSSVLDDLNIAAMISFIVGFILYLKKVSLYRLILLGAVLGIFINILI